MICILLTENGSCAYSWVTTKSFGLKSFLLRWNSEIPIYCHKQYNCQLIFCVCTNHDLVQWTTFIERVCILGSQSKNHWTSIPIFHLSLQDEMTCTTEQLSSFKSHTSKKWKSGACFSVSKDLLEKCINFATIVRKSTKSQECSVKRVFLLRI